MDKPGKIGLPIGIIGGIGLGLLVGSECSGRFITLLGAVFLGIFLICLGVFSYKKSENGTDNQRSSTARSNAESNRRASGSISLSWRTLYSPPRLP